MDPKGKKGGSKWLPKQETGVKHGLPGHVIVVSTWSDGSPLATQDDLIKIISKIIQQRKRHMPLCLFGLCWRLPHCPTLQIVHGPPKRAILLAFSKLSGQTRVVARCTLHALHTNKSTFDQQRTPPTGTHSGDDGGAH